MLFRKITIGHVVQVFNDAGEPVAQRFGAGDEVIYETGDGDPINIVDMPRGGQEYLPFDMTQPTTNSHTIPEVVDALFRN